MTKRVVVINPNTSPVMTEEIRTTAARVFPTDWQCSILQATGGPESLESSFDYALATGASLDLVRTLGDVDGIVLACFGDPGLSALKEVCPAPVVGIAEAACATALLIGYRFGILMGRGKAIPLTDVLLASYGLSQRCAGIAALDMPVLSFSDDRARTVDRLVLVGRELEQGGAESILLGCAGLTGLSAEVERRLGLPIIDPVEAGCRQLALLLAMGLKTSRGGLYAMPPPQRMNRPEAVFAPGLSDWLRARSAT